MSIDEAYHVRRLAFIADPWDNLIEFAEVLR
jgi:hypothetical protein